MRGQELRGNRERLCGQSGLKDLSRAEQRGDSGRSSWSHIRIPSLGFFRAREGSEVLWGSGTDGEVAQMGPGDTQD